MRAIIVYPDERADQQPAQGLENLCREQSGRSDPFRLLHRARKGGSQKRIQDDPPHILLTNYVMLEYMMLRATSAFHDAATANLEFLVLDELHTYRGRQGADVAMLMRVFVNEAATRS